MNIAAGGIKLVIVILVSLDKYPQYFCYENKENTGDISIHRKKVRGAFPWEFRMFMNKEINNEENKEGEIEKAEQSLNISWVIENFQLLFHRSFPRSCLQKAP